MFESETKPIWWLPTIGLFIFIAIELAMFAGTDKIFEDPGVGRHLRTAQFILESSQIPRADLLSYTHGGEPWIDYEWGFETTMGEIYRAGGLPLIGAFCYALFAFTNLIVYRTLLQAGLSLSVVVLYTTMVFMTLHLHFAVRPVLFTYFFLAFVIYIWRGRQQPLMRDWLILPVVFLAWINLHAGWSAAMAFLGGSIFGRFLDRVSGRVNGDEAPLIPWIGLTLLCLLATWFNPWGWSMHYHVFEWTTSYKSFALWDEYLPPNFSVPTMSAIAVFFILTVVFLARILTPAPVWSWEWVLPILFFLYEGLKAQRHVLFLVPIAAVPVGRDLQALMQIPWSAMLRGRLPVIAEVLEGLGERLNEFQKTQRRAGADVWMAMVMALVFTGLYLRAPISQHIQVGGYGPKLYAFLREHPDRFKRPLTSTANAGPLLWNMRPDFRDSIDDRGDFYGDAVIFDFVSLSKNLEGSREKIEKDRYDSAILDTWIPVNQLFQIMPDWKEVYHDDNTEVYWKDSPAGQ